jgi:hypothetical protein
MSNPVIGAEETTSSFAGRLFGRKLGDGPEPGAVGLLSLSPATEKRVTAARRYWDEIDPSELEAVNENEFADRDGNILSVIASDPLLGNPEEANVTSFAVADGRIFFLAATGETVAGREAARLAADDDAARLAREHDDWLAGQPQQDVFVPDAPTLRDSVLQVISHGGQITADGLGGIRVTLPERLNSGGVLDGGMVELETRRALQVHLENLVRCQRVVLNALNGSAKKPLHERVPDGRPTITGGVG